MIIFLFLLRQKNNENKINTKKTKVAMCTIAKKENRYIKYFIEFYKNLGYDHIYLYDNNEINDESIDDLKIVKDGIQDGFISVIDYKKNLTRVVTESYYDCYEHYYNDYDWISFFDIDEYLILEEKHLTIQQFLDNPRFNNCDNVKINWRVFTDNDQLDYINKPLIERFPEETEYKFENSHVKSTIRGGLNYKKFRRNYSPHSIYSGIKACSSSGKRANCKPRYWPADLKLASLNHYVTKSVREFFYKKYKTKINVDTISRKRKKYLFNYFFKINKKSNEKVRIFNQIYHTNFQ